MKKNINIKIILLFLLLFGDNSFADDIYYLPSINVEGNKNNGLISKSYDDIRKENNKIPGASNTINLDKKTGNSYSINSYFDYTPGVVVTSFFGGNDHPTISIRGSGVQNHPSTTGILFLENGIPINEADGSYFAGILEPSDTKTISVHRGSNAIHPFANTLGGEMDFIGKSGRDERLSLSASYGSFRTSNVRFAVGSKLNDIADIHFAFRTSKSNGFTDWSSQRRDSFRLNFGFMPNINFENRTWLAYTTQFFMIPGPRPLQFALDYPTKVMERRIPMIPITRPYRDTQRASIANRTIYKIGNFTNDFSIFYRNSLDNFTIPIFERKDNVHTYGIQYSLNYNKEKLNTGFDISWMKSDYDTKYKVNPSIPIPVFFFLGRNNYEGYASLLSIQSYLSYEIVNHLNLVARLKWVNAKRKLNETRYGAYRDFMTKVNPNFYSSPTKIDDKWSWFAPKIGLVWNFKEDQTFYANISSTKDLPTFLQSTQFQLLVPGPRIEIIPLTPQSSITYEIGGRGRINKNTNWEISLYRSNIKNAIIDFSPNGFSIYGLNHDYKSRYQGIEAGLFSSYDISENQSLGLNLSYNFFDYKYLGGMFGKSKVAGIPKHLLTAELIYRYKNFDISPNLRYFSKSPADHSNNVTVPGYTIFGLKANYNLSDNGSLFVQVDNVFNKKYIVSTATPTKADDATLGYFPGTKRIINFGVKLSF